jgi:hypothetical protein
MSLCYINTLYASRSVLKLYIEQSPHFMHSNHASCMHRSSIILHPLGHIITYQSCILHQSCMHQTMHHIVSIMAYLNIHHVSCILHHSSIKLCINHNISFMHLASYLWSLDLLTKVKSLSRKVQFSLAPIQQAQFSLAFLKPNRHWHPWNPIFIGTYPASLILIGIPKAQSSLASFKLNFHWHIQKPNFHWHPWKTSRSIGNIKPNIHWHPQVQLPLAP